MLEPLRAMPSGVRLFVLYGVVVLAVIALLMPDVVGLAVETPVTGPGLVLMLLLAYTVFTLTLVLQRKRVALWLARGLSSLTLPAVVFFAVADSPPGIAVATILAAALYLGLARPSARAYFDQP